MVGLSSGRTMLAAINSDMASFVPSWEKASDHAPVWAVIGDSATAERKPAKRGGKTAPSPRASKSTAAPPVARGRAKTRSASATEATVPRRPLLVIDGDSFAHRSYHALPKTIRRRGNKGGGAIVGFANFLLRLYETERPRAVMVAWDTLDEPTYRHRALADYQGGREFDTELVDQLDILPDFVAACGFANAKAPGYEAPTVETLSLKAFERARADSGLTRDDIDGLSLRSRRA